MAAFVREFLQITRESSYLTPKAAPVRGTDQIVIRLDGPNKFTMRAVPVTVPVNSGGGYNVEVDTISDKTELKGALSTRLCYSQAPMLLGASLTRINSGQTAPWTTTEPVNQFASICIDHAIFQENAGTYKRTRYLGVKVDGGAIDVSEDSQEASINLDLIGSTYQGNPYDASADPNATVFPAPADNEFPTDYVLFIHSNGAFSIGGSPFTQYTSLNPSWQNSHDAKFYANRFVQELRSYGRKVKLDANLKLVSSPDLRAAFQALTAQTVSVAFTNGINTITLNYLTNARIEGLDDDLPLGTQYMRKLSLGSRYASASSDVFTYVYA